MALAGNYARAILIDSGFRNRAKYPLQGDFVLIPEEGKGNNGITEPVGIGYPLRTGLVNTYVAGQPSYLELQVAIPISFPENVLLNAQIEILVGTTSVSRGSAKVIGFGTVSPIVRIYFDDPIPGTVNGDTVIIRQLASSKPVHRHVLTAGSNIGDTTLTLIGGSSKTNYYVGMYFGVLGATQNYKISAYNATTQVITFAPPLSATLSIGNILEIYPIEDNNSGLSKSGHVIGGMFNYEIRLDWINVPNVSLFKAESSSVAKKITEFPYLLVEFRNDNGSTDAIQSNNRNAKGSTFIIPVDDRSTGSGNFITLRGSNSVVHMLDLNGKIRFTVRVPSGDIVYFDEYYELASPQVSNPDLQISAHFTVRRIH